MVSHSEVLNDILTLLAQAENRTLPFSSFLQTTTFSRRELLYLLDSLEQAGLISRTTDFWGDSQNYTLLMSVDEMKRNYSID
jgi:DNA-binding IclR family transcriptional regulator